MISDGELDANFKAQVYASGNVSGFARQSDGKMIINGNFKSINNTPRQNIARLNQDGSVDLSFNPATVDIPISITDIGIHPASGKIYVSGIYVDGNSSTVYRLIRLNSDGSRDTTFATATADAQFGIRVLESDGKIFIFGTFGRVNNVTTNSIARLNPDGSLDQSFNAGSIIEGFRQARAVVVQNDGKIVVAGNFTVQNTQRQDIVRLNPNGSLDITFTTMVAGITISALRLQPDDKILIGGIFSTVNGVQQDNFSRLNADGTLDTSVNISSLQIREINSIELQPDGKIIFSGGFTQQGSTNSRIIRINPDGSRDLSFTVDNNGGASRLFLLPEGKILIGGGFTRINGVLSPGIALLNENGSINTAYQAKAFVNGSISALATLSNGKILIAGSFISVNGEDRRSLVRLNIDGSVDSSFIPPTEILEFSSVVFAIKVQPDQKILLAGGSEYRVNNVLRRGIARLTPEGLIDSSFNPGFGTDGSVYALEIQPDGKIIIGGEFSSFNFIQRNKIARINSNGSLDTSFNAGISGGNVRSLALQPDGKLIAGGDFTNINSNVRRCLVRLNEDSSLDSSFNTGLGVNSFCSISDIALQPDGKIFIGGGFQSIENINRNAVARLNSNGSLDASFNTGEGANSIVRRIALQPDGKLVVAGEILIFNNVLVNSIARVNNNGSLDPSFQTGAGVEFPERILSLVLQRNGKILIGGSFDSYNNTPQFGIARLLNPSIFSQITPFDFDGDGRADTSVFRNGAWYINRSQQGFTGINWGFATDVLAPADFDGDGKTDVSVFRDGNWYWINSSNNQFNGVQFGAVGDIPVPADYDGDGKADVSVFRPSSGTWYRFNSSNNQFVGTQFGANGDKPLIGDFDGDGKADLAVIRAANVNLFWYWQSSSNNQFNAVQFGLSTDIATAADYDGDGKTDVSVFRPSNGTWYRLNSSQNNQFAGTQFGQSGDIPVPADYDGDGKTDIGVFRQGNWYRLNSANNSFYGEQFGVATDKPVPSALIR
ncbi:MAG TPA: FG-GAP-like repeat-containing protein [Pyrinomonadaceae bacterium]